MYPGIEDFSFYVWKYVRTYMQVYVYVFFLWVTLLRKSPFFLFILRDFKISFS